MAMNNMDLGSNSYKPEVWAFNTYYVQGIMVHVGRLKKRKGGAKFFFFLLINSPHQDAAFVTTDEATLAHGHHPDSPVYRARSCAFEGF